LTEFIETKQNQCWIYVTENRGATANVVGPLTKIVIYNSYDAFHGYYRAQIIISNKYFFYRLLPLHIISDKNYFFIL